MKLIDSPHRFTRDIDLLRRRGRPSPDKLREMFREIAAVPADDGITFKSDGIRAVKADHDEDGYDGVKVYVRATVERREVEVRVDVGFGDAVLPPASRRLLVVLADGGIPPASWEPGGPWQDLAGLAGFWSLKVRKLLRKRTFPDAQDGRLSS